MFVSDMQIYLRCVVISVVISRPRSRDSSALEFIFQRSRSWSRVISLKVSNLVSSC